MRRTDEPRSWQREFEHVVLVHRGRLYRQALSLCRNRTDAEDLVQETLLRAFRRFDQFTAGSNCVAWLATILRNIFLNQVTRQGSVDLLDGEDALERAVANWGSRSATPTPEEVLLGRVIDDQRLARALDRLPRRFREVLLLADVEELSYREIAQSCELPIGTVMSRLFRARRLLRTAFGLAPAGSAGGRRRMPNAAVAHPLRREVSAAARG
ncbi:MAG: hypothetical protein A3F92_01020 [Candidatus Rokubacteria bacterium RIFCSPLOWO2_12_FULL_71_22]|nr:MAG: hypothetical protein A3F92_01020 [Candidatus Rokubacteria bacterium RIFCSPLOWO2_12_FULL_71_22]